MPEPRWMLHDGSFRAAIWPFTSRYDAERWGEHHGMEAFVAAPLTDGLAVPVPPAPDAPRLPLPQPRRRISSARRASPESPSERLHGDPDRIH
jgi:hypothetical protein